MAIIKKYDFTEIEYTGRLKEDGTIFDTTQADIAKKNGLYNEDSSYEPMVICIGEGNMLKGLEKQMIGKETGREHVLEIRHEDAFGNKDAKLIQLIPMSKFRQQKIEPVPGLRLNIDGIFGIVKIVSGGRCLVDFNHSLAGRDLVYTVRINRVVEDDKEKLNSLLKMHFRIHDAEIELNNGSAEIKMKFEVPGYAQEELRNAARKTIPGIKEVNFSTVKEGNK